MDYSKLKLDELRTIAKEKGLRNISNLKKGELVDLLTNVEQMINRPVARKEKNEENSSRPEAEKDINKTVKKDSKTAEEKNTKKTARKTKTEAEDKAVKTDKKGKIDKSEKAAAADKAEKSEKVASAEKAENAASAKASEAVAETKKEEAAEGDKADASAVKTDNRQAGRARGRQADRRPERKPVRGQQAQSDKAQERVPGRSQQAQPDKAQDRNRQNQPDKAQQSQPERSREEASYKEADKQQALRKPDEAEVKNENAAPQSEEQQPANSIMQYDGQEYNSNLASGEHAYGILEVMAEGYGFVRSDNYMPGDKDIYISPAQIRRFRLKTGDIIRGPIRKKMNLNEKFRALLYIESVNGMFPSQLATRMNFEDMTPIFPCERIKLDYNNAPISLRIVDLFSPIGKGQRGMIVSPPKAGKTTLLKQIAKRISVAYPDMNLLVLLIDERPEEVTDIRESIEGPNAEVIYSTFDELPEHHKRVSEMVIERAKRLVESKKDVVILIDSITRLSRAYNLTVPPSGRTLSGGLDPAALHMPKKFFGAARNMREGGSLTILATALIDTGSRMDDVVFEEFKGTGNMELVLDRNLSEKRVFPAIDIAKSGTRKDDLLLTAEESDVLDAIHSQLRGLKSDEITEEIIKIFSKTRNNREFLDYCRKIFMRK